MKYATDITATKLAAATLDAAVKETSEVIAATQAKDLTRRIPIVGKSGEIQALCSGINSLLDSFTDVIHAVSDISGRITVGSRRIGADSKDLAQRTEEQAASLEETAATTEELAASVKQSFERATEVAQLGLAANDIANRGGAVVRDAVDAMQRIEKASENISAIFASSTTLPSRRTCLHSTPPSKRRVPATQAGASPSSHPKSARWHSVRARPLKTSPI